MYSSRVSVSSPSPSAPASLGQTQASSVYDRLRRDLLTGRLAPGQRLTARFLMERYDAGQTPLREALNRLSSEGLVVSQDQRGFTVASVSIDELTELTETRCWVEEIALRRSMAATTPEWEETLVVLCHRLLRTTRSASDEHYAENLEWEGVHRSFHRALLSMCGSRTLRAFCDQLADQLYRYRQLSVQKIYPRRNINDEHQSILAAILRNDADAAVAALQSHYRATASVILADLPHALDAAEG
jgi:DNA-binding GntR family transcriptional regulator